MCGDSGDTESQLSYFLYVIRLHRFCGKDESVFLHEHTYNGDDAARDSSFEKLQTRLVGSFLFFGQFQVI